MLTVLFVLSSLSAFAQSEESADKCLQIGMNVAQVCNAEKAVEKKANTEFEKLHKREGNPTYQSYSPALNKLFLGLVEARRVSAECLFKFENSCAKELDKLSH